MVGVAQLVERWIVVPVAEGSNPSTHPKFAMPHQFSTSYLADSLTLLRQYKSMGEGAMSQVSDEQLVQPLDPESNSIATIVKHMAGNMRSRWTDFLTTDGEKPDRDRDSEFEQPPSTRAELMKLWDEGWGRVFAAIEPLTGADLTRAITIRGEPHSVIQAINRAVAHYAAHIGQIVFISKHYRAGGWKTLSMPRRKIVN